MIQNFINIAFLEFATSLASGDDPQNPIVFITGLVSKNLYRKGTMC